MRREKKKRKIWLAEGLSQRGRSEMCDYSLHSVKSRPAKVGDKLTTRDFGTGNHEPSTVRLVVRKRDTSLSANVSTMIDR